MTGSPILYYIFALENSNALLIRLQEYRRFFCLFILETVSTEVNVQDKNRKLRASTCALVFGDVIFFLPYINNADTNDK